MLDLGSGGGIDVFLAAAKVGPTGQVVGLDGSSVSPTSLDAEICWSHERLRR